MRLLAVDLLGGVFDRLHATSLDVSLCSPHVFVPPHRPAIDIDHLGVREAAELSSLLRRDQVHEGLALELGFLCHGLDGGGRMLSLFLSLHLSEEPIRGESTNMTEKYMHDVQNIGSTETDTLPGRGTTRTEQHVAAHY